MKKTVLLVLFFLLIGSTYAQKHSVDFYKETYRRGFVTLKSDTIKYQKIFFNEFPSNFKELKKLYGWTEQTTYGRTLTYVPPYYFTRFFEIACVSHKALTKKIIDVSVNAVWDADAIALFQRAATQYAITYNKEFVNELQNRSKADAISVWAFYCDYENSYYRKEAYNKLVKAIAPNNKKMVELITAGYKKASAGRKNH